jgi:GGDEF domain-containing protein
VSERLSQSRSYVRIGLVSSIIVGLLLIGFSIQQALIGLPGHRMPLGPFGAVLACMSIYCFLKLFQTIDTHIRRLRDRAVMESGNWAFEYPYIRRRLREEQARLDRQGGSSSMLLIEVPMLAELHEKEGSEKCERAARRVTRLLCETLRESDVTARIAVGLFLALLPDTSPEDARAAAIRLWEESIDSGIAPESVSDPHFVLLVGIGGYTDNGENIDCTFAAAHKALERAAEQDGSSIAVSRKTFRSVEDGDSLMRRVRGEHQPPSSHHRDFSASGDSE